jgi:hypothetical protein
MARGASRLEEALAALLGTGTTFTVRTNTTTLVGVRVLVEGGEEVLFQGRRPFLTVRVVVIVLGLASDAVDEVFFQLRPVT